MGRIGTLLKSEIGKFIELCVETRAGYNQDADLFGMSGEDSPPLADERIILVKIDGAGSYAAVGVLTASQGAKPGEKIFYARDPDAKIVSKIMMLNDGSVSVEADNDISVTTKKGLSVKADGDVKVDAANTEISSSAVKITGGTFEAKGSVAPDGNGPFIAIKVCPISGATICGSKVSGT